MLTSNRSRLVSLLIFVMLFAMLVCCMSVSVFAVEHDHDGDGVADHTDEEHAATEKKGLWDKIKEWGDSKAGQITGFCIAGVLFVAIVVFIVLWIPKKTDRKEKKAVSKKK